MDPAVEAHSPLVDLWNFALAKLVLEPKGSPSKCAFSRVRVINVLLFEVWAIVL